MSGDVGAEVAAALAERLHELRGHNRSPYRVPASICAPCDQDADQLARALAPLIAERVEAAKAEAWREAADDLEATRDEHEAEDEAEGCESRFCGGWLLGQTHAAQKLRDRAAALDSEATS